ncbi:TetR/AcrR family transcriptional regulator [Paraburkholderia sp. CNPSo 3076]|uniref:TetR/AcrR family transcriptional regulator n=1 Tax=Paraburkholderia sp. CNPSo 3076 TaxID=2940936 RepID=UPI0022559A0E|nr:TetR/AcrR family transcriptional regulator [Paraburkholderia sp. CNPSo 3076]MCX5544750.1 TetR/AcrR family transcriptional regulator [Paraburkholderia sp. CNPSo 3076]
MPRSASTARLDSEVSNLGTTEASQRRAPTQRGRDAIARILSVATDMLCEEGYGELTMRKVANSVGISLSNLQFHFKTREDLLGEVIIQLTARYLEQYEVFAQDARLSPEDRLEVLLRHTLAEDKKPRVQSIFFNIWALAQTQDFAREIVDRIYKAQRAILARFIAQINPALTEHECALRAALISCQMEGLMILIPQRKSFPRDLKGLETEVIRAMMALASAPTGSPTTG